MTLVARLIQYLSQQGPHAPKHKTWKHPIAVCLVHYAVSIIMVLSFHDIASAILFPSDKSNNNDKHESTTPLSLDTHSTNTSTTSGTSAMIANFVLIYFVILLSYRILQNHDNHILQKACIYENTWLCNMTLCMGAMGLYTGREVMVMAHVITVSIDQVLWYLDAFGWLLFRTFPIGVAKYLTWPQTSFATRITCTHHLWTIPLLLYACFGNMMTAVCSSSGSSSGSQEQAATTMAIIAQRLDDKWWEAYVMSAFIMSLNVLLSRWMTPFCIIKSKEKEKDDHEKYLNVNLSHELWKDIKFECLQIQRDFPSTGVYVFRLLWRWQLFNGIVLVCILRPLAYVWIVNQELNCIKG